MAERRGAVARIAAMVAVVGMGALGAAGCVARTPDTVSLRMQGKVPDASVTIPSEVDALVAERSRLGIAAERGPVSAVITLQDAREFGSPRRALVGTTAGATGGLGALGSFSNTHSLPKFEPYEAYLDLHTNDRQLFLRFGRQEIQLGDGIFVEGNCWTGDGDGLGPFAPAVLQLATALGERSPTVRQYHELIRAARERNHETAAAAQLLERADDPANHNTPYLPVGTTMNAPMAPAKKFRVAAFDYGAKHSIYNLLMALLDDGDEVIVPTPCWPSHVELVRMAGGVPVLAEQRSEDGFRLDPELLARLITPRTRALLLNSPSNPTGAVYDEASLAAIAAVIRDRGSSDLLIITDDLYRRLVYAPTIWASLCRVAPDLARRTLLIDGVSKTYAMTGWRIGFCAGPRPLLEAMQALQGQVTTNATTIAQHAALAALTGDQAPVEAMRAEFDQRRQVMYGALCRIPGLRCVEPQGAFYCFPDMRAYLRPDGPGPRDDVELCDWLLQHAGIAAIPGTGFFAPGFLRFSYATSLQSIQEGMRRLAKGLGQLGLA